MGDAEDQHAKEVEADILPAVKRAAESAAKKDDLTSAALRLLARSWLVMLAAVVIVAAALVYVVPKIDEINNRSIDNSRILVCSANGYNELGRDLRVLAKSRGEAGPSQYQIPAACKIEP